MKKTGLIALDLDGTLLTSEKCLSEENRQALSRCAQLGIHIVPTTGRPADGIIPEVLKLPGVNYAITTNGGVIVDLKEDRSLKRCVLSNAQVLQVIDIVKKYHVMFDPYVNGRGITQPSFIEHMKEFGISKPLQRLVLATRDSVPDIREHIAATGSEAEKVNIFLADLNDKEIIRQALSGIPGLIISSSMPNNLEVNAEGATKGNALLWLASYLGIDPSATMAFGDGENDITMLKAAGTGIAMANADDNIKAAADQVTLTNDQHGVAHAIHQLILDFYNEYE
ncbi:MAG: HAD family phosphatase [Clostridiales bacterium]|nr:HAD family phosphatase [Clostridiales bacterium]